MSSDPASLMRRALDLAKRNLGQTWPNPAVGCVIVKDGNIIAEGCTARGGRPHAETQALQQAGSAARGGDMYVTLEPCSHHGKTSPCTDAIIAAGIKRCFIACRDPNPKVNGQGIARLQFAGIEISEGIGGEEARDINRGFFSVIENKRPYVALKIATSSDNKISGGKDRWITGEEARNFGHQLRARFDAIATGIGTVLADDPLLTCRLPGLEDRSPVRVIFDRRGRMPKKSQMQQTAAQVPVWPLKQPNLEEALAYLAGQGITRLLVESGQKLSAAFLDEGLVDKVFWFRAPITIGEAGLAAPPLPPHFRQEDLVVLGEDELEVYSA